MADKEDWPPIFSPGEHPLTFEALRSWCVDGFPLSKTRLQIFEGFSRIFHNLRRLSVPAELVVDGSFLTEEIDPEDIDFAVVVSEQYYESLDDASEQKKLLSWIDGKTVKTSHLCDCYLCVEFSRENPLWFEGIQDRAFWVNLYSKSIIYKRVRGVAIVGVSSHESAASS
jgi:hypothetical protein